MPTDVNSLANTKWTYKYHIIFAPKYRRQVIYGKIQKRWDSCVLWKNREKFSEAFDTSAVGKIIKELKEVKKEEIIN